MKNKNNLWRGKLKIVLHRIYRNTFICYIGFFRNYKKEV